MLESEQYYQIKFSNGQMKHNYPQEAKRKTKNILDNVKNVNIVSNHLKKYILFLFLLPIYIFLFLLPTKISLKCEFSKKKNRILTKVVSSSTNQLLKICL